MWTINLPPPLLTFVEEGRGEAPGTDADAEKGKGSFLHPPRKAGLRSEPKFLAVHKLYTFTVVMYLLHNFALRTSYKSGV